MQYQIAGLSVRLEGLKSPYLEHRMRKYAQKDGGIDSADLCVTFQENNAINVPAGRNFCRLDAWYWIDRGEDGYTGIKQVAKYHLNLVRVDINKACTRVNIEYFDVKDMADFTTEQMLHYILGEVFTFCQTLRGATVLHSAAMAYRGQAVLFSAPSETGKSTHTQLWKQFYQDDVVLFNDDTPVIRPKDAQFVACGTPWSGKTEINENREYPLAGIVFLKQVPENTIRRLSPIEAAVNLMNQTHKPVFEHLMDKHMDILQAILQNVPVYELGCTISKEAVDLVKDTLFQE